MSIFQKVQGKLIPVVDASRYVETIEAFDGTKIEVLRKDVPANIIAIMGGK